MPIRLKFKAISITDVGGGAGKMVNLAPVFHDGEHDNTQHFRSNSGQMLVLGSLYPQSADLFNVGEEYWIDFTPVHGEAQEEQHGDQPQEDDHRDQPAQARQPRSRQQTQDFRQPSRPTRATQTLRSAREPQRSTQHKSARSSLTTKSHRASVRR
jgi:hypothetical protein